MVADERAGLRSGVRRALPFALGTTAFGISFGLLARSLHLGVAAPIVMSSVVWAGSAQFAALGVLGAGGAGFSAVVAGILLNARYMAMAAALVPWLPAGRLRRALTAVAITDESWSLAARPEGGFDLPTLLGASSIMYVGWIAGTALGVLGGGLLGDARTFGLDAAFPALYLAIAWRQLTSARRRLLALAAAGVVLVLTPFVPPGVPICAACLLAAFAIRRP